jgi:WhiB family transcriptional regulator, redox-sensing transcriptional regulator
MTAPANWRDDAACRDADPELFFPLGAAGPALGRIREAKRICQACRAQTRCLAWALDNEVTDGEIRAQAARTRATHSFRSVGSGDQVGCACWSAGAVRLGRC